jgi:hypothetical protein
MAFMRRSKIGYPSHLSLRPTNTVFEYFGAHYEAPALKIRYGELGRAPTRRSEIFLGM